MNKDCSETFTHHRGVHLPRINAQRATVAVLLAVTVFLLVELIRFSPTAGAQVPVSGRSGRFLAVPGRLTGDSYGVYIIDLENGIINVYQWVPGRRGTGKLKLLAARNINYDLQLDEYNTEPSPKEIKKLVNQSRRLENSQPQ